MPQTKSILRQALSALLQLLTRLIIYLGLPLLAWGTGDLVGFFSNPARLGYAIVVAAQSLIIAWLFYITPPFPEHEHRFDLVDFHLYAFEIILVLSAYGDRRNTLTWNENLPLRWLGLGIFLAGAALALWSNLVWIRHLRHEGSRSVDNPVLLTEGPYTWIRYPNLLYLFFYCLGFVLICRSWAGLVLLLVLVYGVARRSKDLDQVFAERYKEAWILRVNKSRRIVPFVY